jgi:hypothetical protein
MTAENERAYDKIDRYLRANLGDADYAEYSAALESVLAAFPAPTAAPEAPTAEPCPRGADKPEPTCTNRHQCWEPCGELGHSAEHAVVHRPAVERVALPTPSEQPTGDEWLKEHERLLDELESANVTSGACSTSELTARELKANEARAALLAHARLRPAAGPTLTNAQREFASLSEPNRRALTGASVSIQVGAHALPYMKHNPDQWLCFQYNNLDEVVAALRSVKAWDSAGYRAKDDANDTSRPSAAGGEAVAQPQGLHVLGALEILERMGYRVGDRVLVENFLRIMGERDLWVIANPLVATTAQAGDATNAADGVSGMDGETLSPTDADGKTQAGDAPSEAAANPRVAPSNDPTYFCNKCGYFGPVQVFHQRPNGSGKCDYMASLMEPSPAPCPSDVTSAGDAKEDQRG